MLYVHVIVVLIPKTSKNKSIVQCTCSIYMYVVFNYVYFQKQSLHGHAAMCTNHIRIDLCCVHVYTCSICVYFSIFLVVIVKVL